MTTPLAIIGAILGAGPLAAGEGYPALAAAAATAEAPVAHLPEDPMLEPVALRGQPGLPVGRAAPPDLPAPGAAPAFGPLGLPCTATMKAEPGAGATARLRIEAPCLPSAVVTVTHGDLSASFRTTSSGQVDAVFPAFDEQARYTAVLPDGDVLSASARVPGARGYEHVATMWEGSGGLSIHAFEYGAAPGEAGHVWRGAARAPTVAEAGRGGFLLSLGTPGLANGRRAEVYSFPAAEAARSGAVRIALAAAVTPATCGREIGAETLQLGEGLPGAPVEIRLTLPGCGAEAGDLMLKNLARDLKIAAR